MTARNDALNALRVCSESGGTFCRVEHAQPTTCPGSHVKQTTPAFESGDDEVDGSGDVRFYAIDGLWNAAIFLDHELDDLLGVGRVDVEGAWISSLGRKTRPAGGGGPRRGLISFFRHD